MKHNYFGSYLHVELRPLTESDIELLRVWRNNTEQTKYLRKIDYITPEKQREWYDRYLKNRNDYVWGIFETNELNCLVGSLSIYDKTSERAEIGKIQIGDPRAHGRAIGRISLVIAMKIGFEKLGLKEIYASVHRDNVKARNNDLRIGFKVIGSHKSCVGGVEDELTINADELCKHNDYFDEIKLFEK